MRYTSLHSLFLTAGVALNQLRLDLVTFARLTCNRPTSRLDGGRVAVRPRTSGWLYQVCNELQMIIRYEHLEAIKYKQFRRLTNHCRVVHFHGSRGLERRVANQAPCLCESPEYMSSTSGLRSATMLYKPRVFHFYTLFCYQNYTFFHMSKCVLECWMYYTVVLIWI